MIDKIGYACINNHLKPLTFKDCRLKSVYKYGIDYLREKILNNISLTNEILKWNINNDIYMYRVTSRILPLVTHPDILNDFSWRWQEDNEILNGLNDIKNTVTNYNIRLSMHPDQFTVINSVNNKVIKNSIVNLHYHYDVLNKMGGKDIIIHTGGVYGDKDKAIKRFITTFNSLDEVLRNSIRLENDDVSYNIDDVIYISEKTNVPIILDIHHHNCNNTGEDIKSKIKDIKKSWKSTNLIPKVHISSGKEHETDKRHHDYIKDIDVQKLIDLFGDIDFDMMVEAKKKDEAVLKILDKFKIKSNINTST